MEKLQPTCDPEIFIEEKYEGYIRYRRINGERWELIGVCTGIGKCWEGANGPKPELDCPLTPTYKNDCCKFEINVLPNGDKIIL